MNRARRVSVPPKRFRDGSPGGSRAPAKEKRVNTVENLLPSQEDMIPCGQGSKAPSLAPPSSPSLYEDAESSGGEMEMGEAVDRQEDREFEQASGPGPSGAGLVASQVSPMVRSVLVQGMQALPAEAAAGVMSLLQALVAADAPGGSIGSGPVCGPSVGVGPGPSSGPVRPGAGPSFGPGLLLESGEHAPYSGPGLGPMGPGLMPGLESGWQAGASVGPGAGQGQPSAGSHLAPVLERGSSSVSTSCLAGRLEPGRPIASSSPYEVASGVGLPVAACASIACRGPAPSGDALPVWQPEPETPLQGHGSDRGHRGRQAASRSGSSRGTRTGRSGVPGPRTGPAGGVGGTLLGPVYDGPRVQQQGQVCGVPGSATQGNVMSFSREQTVLQQQGQLSGVPGSATQVNVMQAGRRQSVQGTQQQRHLVFGESAAGQVSGGGIQERAFPDRRGQGVQGPSVSRRVPVGAGVGVNVGPPGQLGGPQQQVVQPAGQQAIPPVLLQLLQPLLNAWGTLGGQAASGVCK
ncbi:decreased expression in renal and prostate cancer protein-like [Bombina bombina]|uniref:decreased expression in renal and prostate cancer protein-like n=1 Tax=Bombina bombina TaxID=8345 RepID=UPI00235AEA80|nr:decreased expression in renal and prostate cancer protein-like [Bombina bombina]